MNSHRTAIARKSLPVPVRWLLAHNLLHGHVLDYGCGKCYVLNNRTIRDHPGVFSITSYDPYFAPWEAPIVSANLRWDVIFCSYVLCTLPKAQEKSILEDIQKRLSPDGKAYIIVRSDRPKQGYGKSSRGTYQRKVKLNLPLHRETSQYRMYVLTSFEKLE
jgi:hypothetical protein